MTPGGGAARSGDGWSAVVVDARGALGEELTARLAADGIGADERETATGGISLRIWFDDSRPLEQRLDAVRRTLFEAQLPAADWSTRVEHVDDGRWVERWVERLRPFPLGRRFVVDPDGSVDPATTAREPLRLVPGRAFGTGEHPTTRLCTVALERFVEPRSRWLDVGCGSGILSLVAARCGARPVLGLDLDPEAIAVAREVFHANGAPAAVGFAIGSLESAGGVWDGVVVNIESRFLDARVHELVAALAAGGVLLVSGLLAGERRSAERRLVGAGLAPIGAAEDDGWALVAGRRIAPA